MTLVMPPDVCVRVQYIGCTNVVFNENDCDGSAVRLQSTPSTDSMTVKSEAVHKPSKLFWFRVSHRAQSRGFGLKSQ